MTATEYEQQAHRTIAGHAAENITYLGFGLMAEAGEGTNSATCFGSLQ